MKIVLTIALICGFAVCVLPQNHKALEPLPETATLDDAQQWLKKALGKFSRDDYDAGATSVYMRISEIKFSGCEMTYRFIERRSRQSASSSIGSPTNAVPPVDLSTIYSFDLSDIDTDNILIRPSIRKPMKAIVLNTISKKNTIQFRSNPNTRVEDAGIGNRTRLEVRADVIEQIRDGLIRTVQLCKQSKH